MPLLPAATRSARNTCLGASRTAFGLPTPRALVLGAGSSVLLSLALALGAPAAQADDAVPTGDAQPGIAVPTGDAQPGVAVPAADPVADGVLGEGQASNEVEVEVAAGPETGQQSVVRNLAEAEPLRAEQSQDAAEPLSADLTPHEVGSPSDVVDAVGESDSTQAFDSDAGSDIATEPASTPENPSDASDDDLAEQLSDAPKGDAPADAAPALEAVSSSSPSANGTEATDLAAGAGITTLSARAAAAPKLGFTDVPANLMFASDILWLQSSGIAQGWPDGTFRPHQSIARDAFVAMLFRLQAPSGYKAPATSRFVDVDTSNQFYREISWAAGAGVTTGWGDGTFRPLAPIQRDAALAMLHRVYGPSAPTPAPARSPFLDVDPSTAHYTAMAWGYANGITTGWSDGTIRPTTPIGRDAMAAMLHRVVGPRPPASAPLYAGPTGAYAAQQSARTGAPSGLAYRYGEGLRQDTARGAILYNPATRASSFLSGAELRWYDATAGAQSHGLPTTERVAHGSGVLQEFDRSGIYGVDGWTFTIEGQLFSRYKAAGGITGRLGAPSGPAMTGTSGISYQNFTGGILTTPDFLDSPPPTTPVGATKLRYPTLQLGSTGDFVYAVQVKVGATADARFGTGTRDAVMAFQRGQGLPATGIVDARTWARIISVPDQVFDGSNGRIHPRDLVVIAPGWTLARPAAEAYRAMSDALARETGRTFVINDAYRPIDRQIQMMIAFGRPQATYPGTSNHGDATTGALDFDLVAGDPTHRWLVANAARFGFTQTPWQRMNEPWHWQRA